MSDPSFVEARDILMAAKRVAAFSGAGLSAESGLSTFRGENPDALWSKFDETKLASREGFTENPVRIVDWYNWRRSQLARAAPNPAHAALAGQPRLVHITQNVDDLLERAGVPGELIHHLHGTILKDRCDAACGHEEIVDLMDPPSLRKCPECGELMRPAVVWFGEYLPNHVWHKAQTLCNEIDCLLVIGTSVTVWPAAGLVEIAKSGGSKVVVVNTQPSETNHCSDLELIGSAGTVLPKLLDKLSLRTI